jgi:alkyl hydroperoxide reductase subunit AhpF
VTGSPSPQDVAARLAALPAPVRLVFFTQTFGCDPCLPARQVVDQIAGLSEQITVEEYNLVLDKEQVAAFGIDKVPGLAVVGAVDFGIRYYGVPTGYEVGSLIDAIELAATGDHGLAPESVEALAGLDRDLHLQVFVTPT